MRILNKLKSIFAVALMTVTALGVSGQSRVFDNPANRPYWGARIGLDVTCPGDLEVNPIKINAFKAGAGISFGAVYNYPVVANLYVEPGAMFFYNTTGVEDGMLEASFDTPEGYTSLSMREFGLRIPVMIGYHFDFDAFSLKVFTGPSFRWGLRGRENYKMKSGSSTITESTDLYDDGFNSFDVQWGLGVGATIDRFDLTLQGAFGLRNGVDIDNVKWHRNLFVMTFGYNF